MSLRNIHFCVLAGLFIVSLICDSSSGAPVLSPSDPKVLCLEKCWQRYEGLCGREPKTHYKCLLDRYDCIDNCGKKKSVQVTFKKLAKGNFKMSFTF